MKFSALKKGTRAIRKVVLPLLKDEAGNDIELGLRPLTGGEYAEVIANAIAFAREKGAPKAIDGDTLYDLAVMAYTLVIGAVDPDKDDSPFFDTGVDAMLATGNVDRPVLGLETIVYLFEQHELWQNVCSPYEHRMTTDEVVAKAREVAGPQGERDFMRMSPAMRMVFTRSMAVQLLTSLELKSSSTSISSATTPL